MSYIDELRNTPRDNTRQLTPQEQELQELPNVYLLVESIKNVCMREQRQGKNQFQGMLYRVWTQAGDGDGGYMNPEWSYDFRSGIIGKQKLTEHATEFAQRTLYRAKSLPTKEEINQDFLDELSYKRK